jgi:hypothetical protein
MPVTKKIKLDAKAKNARAGRHAVVEKFYELFNAADNAARELAECIQTSSTILLGDEANQKYNTTLTNYLIVNAHTNAKLARYSRIFADAHEAVAQYRKDHKITQYELKNFE